MATICFIVFLLSLQYTTADGPQSHLFSQCFEEPLTIAVSENEEYVRYEPELVYEMAWVEVDLGTSWSIFDCAESAFDLGALMFRFDTKCTVSLNDTYNPSRKQSSDDSNSEVVYISSRVAEMNFLGDIFVGEDDSYGCLRRNTANDGWVYGREDGRNVAEDSLPLKDTCCWSAATDYCLVAECSDQPMSYCEAEARCLARGFRPASRRFHETVNTVDHTELHTDEYYFWVNIYQEQADIWKWQDDGSNLENFEWCTITEAQPTSNCAAIHFTNESHKIEYYRTDCTGTDVKCILCYAADLRYC